jgi:glucose uptake protein
MVPTTYAVTLALMILSMLCWGSWANTTKLAKSYRFELFYIDYSIAVFLCCTVAALTLGQSDAQGLAFSDNLETARRINIGFALAAGAIFNLGNMLLVAAIGVAGMAVAFPIAIGLALVGGVLMNYIIHPAGNPLFLFGGVFLVFLAIILGAFAHAAKKREDIKRAEAKLRAEAKEADAARAAKALAAGSKTPTRTVTRKVKDSPWKGIVLSLVGGLLIAAFYPLITLSQTDELSLGVYTAAFCFSLGILITTPVYTIFFMRIPVEGTEVGFMDYFRAKPVYHLFGILGGAVWAVGTLANFVASAAPAQVNVGPATSYALGQGATLISALWGLLVWREFKGALPGVVKMLVVMLLLYVAGLGLISVAPLFRK